LVQGLTQLVSGLLGAAGLIAVVFQDFEQYAFTAHDNIAFADVQRLADEDGVRQAARRADADVVISQLSTGTPRSSARCSRAGRTFRSVNGSAWPSPGRSSETPR
jgi:hypothetical protein